MNRPGGFDPDFVGQYVLRQGHSGWLGLRYTAHGDDWVELELPWRADLAGETGGDTLASGPIVSLMDMASGMSIWQRSGTFVAIATLDLRVDYLRPAHPRRAVVGRAQCYRVTRSAAFVRGVAHDGDAARPVANLAGVFMSIPVKTEA